MKYLRQQTVARSFHHTQFSSLEMAPDLSRMYRLTDSDRNEVVAFLSIRPVHTVVMSSFINDNGLDSSMNRGKFIGYRNIDGHLEGVALIGHTTLIEARSTEALRAFAVAAKSPDVPLHIIMSSGNAADTFWTYYANESSQPRLSCTELLFELQLPMRVPDCRWKIRTAKMEELEQVAEAQGEVAFIESGVNPMVTDRDGFLERVAKRIEKNRIFVVFEEGKLVFKADIIADTLDTIYLEGVYVAEEYRGQGVGSACLADLGLTLLNRAQRVSLLSNIDFHGAHRSFIKAGFVNTDRCTTLFV